jgi:hypothetical protein
VIRSTLRRRLKTLEERMTPEEEPIAMEVVFIDAATKQPAGGFQVKLGQPRPPILWRAWSRSHYR